MTHPGGSGGNINLAALWVPVMPETSHLNAEMRKVGAQMKRDLTEGFESASGAEELGQGFASKVAQSFSSHLGKANLGLGISPMIDRLSEQVDEKLASKLKGQLPQLYRQATAAANELAVAQRKVNELESQHSTEIERNKSLITRAQSEIATGQARVNEMLQREQAMIAAGRGPTNEMYRERFTAQRQMMDNESAIGQARERNWQIERAHKGETASAHQESAAAAAKAQEAQEKYNGTLERYGAASQHSFNMGSMMAGMMGGALVGAISGVVSGFEKVIELDVEIFRKAIEGAGELAEKLIEVGEDYGRLNHQLVEFSSATGEAMDNMQAHVRGVFNSLDVAGKDVGQTYAQLGSILNIQAGQPLDDLVRRVTDLQGRFSGLKATDLGGIFIAFKTPVDELNSSLATMVAAGQDSGQGLASIVQGLSGGGADVLEHAGLSLGQAATAVGDIERHGIPANQVMTALQTSMKLFAKQGQSFPEGLQELLKELTGPGTDAQKDALAQAAFGSRRWADGLAIVKDLLRDINSGPTAFDREAQSTDEFLEKTASLDNKIEEFKHHLEGAFQPFGTMAINFAEGGLGQISQWFDEHHDQIIEDIKQWGDEFIDMLPNIKDFASAFIRILGYMMIPLQMFTVGLLDSAAAFAALTGDWDTAKKLLGAGTKVFDMDFTKAFGDAADLVDRIHINTQGIKDDLNSAADSAKGLGSQPTFGLPQGGWGPGTPGEPGQAPGGGAPPPPGMWYSSGGEPIWGSEAPGYTPPSGATQTPPPLGAHPNRGAEPHPPLFTVDPPKPPGPQRGPNYGQMPGGPMGPMFPHGPPGAKPGGYTGPSDQTTMARAIYGAVTGSGYSSETGLYAVAASLLESGLSPTVKEPSGKHRGLFQEQLNYAGAMEGPTEQIAWFVNQLNSLGGPDVVDRDPKDMIADHVEVGGYSGGRYDSFINQAANLLGLSAPTLGGQSASQGDQGPVFTAAKGGSPSREYYGEAGVFGNLLGGIFQSLGLPGVFDNPRKNTGIFNLFPGLAQMVGAIRGFDTGGRSDDDGTHMGWQSQIVPGMAIATGGQNYGTGQFNPNVRIDTSMANQPKHLTAWDRVSNDIFGMLNIFGAHEKSIQPHYASGGPSGKDNIPAWLAPKEYVWNEQAVEKYGWFIDWANRNALSGSHSEAKGFDAGGPASGVLQVIWANPRSGSEVGEASGFGFVGPGTSQPGYYGSDWKDHHGHVHTSWGTSPYGEFYGMPKGTELHDESMSGFPDWVRSLGAQFGVFGTTYAGHQESSGFNRGIDWWPVGVSQDMSGMSYTPEQLERLDNFAQSVASFGVSGGGSDGLAMGPPSGWWQGGDDNYYDPTNVGGASTTGFQSAGYGSGGYSGGGGVLTVKGGTGGTHSGTYGPSGPVGGGPGGGFDPKTGLPGLPGQYGGSGQYGGETQDEVEQHRRDIRDRTHHIEELERQRDRIQNEQLPKLQKQLEAEQNKLPEQQDKDKIQSLTNQIADLERQRDRITNEEIPDAQTDLGSANRKSEEAALKAPKGLEHKKTGEGDAAHELGTQLLGGIAQSLGFPDVFGKPPWEFGSFKLLAGLMNWGWGEMNMLGDAMGWKPSGGGGAGMPGGGGIHMPGLPGVGQFSPHGRTPGPIPVPPGPGGFPQMYPGAPDLGQTSPPGMWGSPGPGNHVAPAVYNIDHSINVAPATDAGIKTAVTDISNSHQYNTGLANTSLNMHPSGT